MIEFEVICGEFLIDPELALENEYIQKAIKEGKDEEYIVHLLDLIF